MIASIPCPNCEQAVDPQARFCEFCGVDLAVAALIAERQVSRPVLTAKNIPIVPEILVPRLGDYLIEKGIIAQVDLDRALELQKQRTESGKQILLGQMLLELNLITSEILDQVITEQILHLQTALRQSNQLLEQRVEERTRDLQHALEKLEELGLVQRVHRPSGCQAFIAAFSGHQHLLICQGCGRVEFFTGDGEQMEALISSVGRDSGYQIGEHWLQLFGLCSRCQPSKAVAS